MSKKKNKSKKSSQFKREQQRAFINKDYEEALKRLKYFQEKGMVG